MSTYRCIICDKVVADITATIGFAETIYDNSRKIHAAEHNIKKGYEDIFTLVPHFSSAKKHKYHVPH